MRTNYGDLVLALNLDAAPRTVAQLLALARLGAYDNVPILRGQPKFRFR